MTSSSSKPVLIIGSREDEHVQAVLSHLGVREPFIVDASMLDVGTFSLHDVEQIATGAGSGRRSLRLGDTHGWVRRLSSPGWRPGAVSGSQGSAERASFLALVVGVASHPKVRWLTPYPHLLAAENKLGQLAHARRLGIDVPRTAVVSDVLDVPAELGDPVVVKPLGPGHFVEADGEARVVWAQALHRHDPRLAALGGAPFLLQEQVTAHRHLRVVTCGQRAWSCELDAVGLPLDWRCSAPAHQGFEVAAEPNVEAQALALAHELGLGYSSQDWLDTGARQLFIDLNPAGQWLFLPEPVRSHVSSAIAEHLCGT